ncbi:MAG TPA: hybrid sensor histidine kinase/response regulator [Nannocystaceae bacterium]|nr:hybrid sensor histidine kinase/response regulator [Nannocystaceae bacterium]
MSRSKQTLLLVDDDPHNVTALVALLEPTGHRLVHANDGVTALELFEREAPDIVLCDLVMAGMDGLEVLRRIRAHRERAHTPVILITAFGEREPRLRALELGVDEFLEKPIDAAILRARVTTLLRLKLSRDDLAGRHAALQRLQREQREVLDVLVNDVTGTIGGLQTSVDWLDQYADVGPGAVHQAVTEMREGLGRLTTIVNDLSWVSWLDASAFPVALVQVRLDVLLGRVVQRFQEAANARGIELQTSTPLRLVVAADERLLRRVIENLLDNALRYVPRGGRVRVEARDGGRAQIWVCNEGPPIPAEDRHRIFEKFTRDPDQPPRPGHPGLGLYFCRRALDVQGAEIEATDEPGWPAAFVIRFPRRADATLEHPTLSPR